MFHGNIHRHLLTLSLVNWAIAIVCWTVSAYLGVARPTDIFVYTVLFVVGLFAVVVAVGSFVLATFGTEPGRPAVETGPTAEPAAAAEAPEPSGGRAAGPGA